MIEIDKESSRVRVGRVPRPDHLILQQVSGLRSSRRVLGRRVAGWTGARGETRDAIFELDSWTLRFFMIDVSGCRPGGIALIQPDLIEAASWDQRALRIAIAHVEVLSEPDIDVGRTELDPKHLPSRPRSTLH